MANPVVIVCLVVVAAWFAVGPAAVTGQGGVSHQVPTCSAVAWSFGVYWMNITSDREEDGFIQLYISAVNTTPCIIQADNASYNKFQDVVTGGGKSYNDTVNYNEQLNLDDPYLGQPISNFGVIVSAQSNTPPTIQGIKSDLGSTDGYMALPVTYSCNEFIIAAWPQQSDFEAEIFVVALLDNTCVELYVIYGGTQYVKLTGGSIDKYQVFRYYAHQNTTLQNGTVINTPEDVTGYFVNATKPVSTYFGHECAWVPDMTVLFCDHMVEQIPPRCQLGTNYIVPPIYGRSPAAGYVVRVVPAYTQTTVTYMGSNKASVALGSFLQINQPVTSATTNIQCSSPCLVMQYNKGFLAAPNDVETDPFMQLIVPVDRFTSGAGFGTANFCEGKKVVVNFLDYLSIVTYAEYAANIQLDGQPILSSNSLVTQAWQPLTGPDGNAYVYIGVSLIPGFHTVSNAPNTFGSFAAYVYGHSLEPDSSSGYGYSVNYNITGSPVCQNWEAAASIIANLSGSGNGQGNAACSSSQVELGQSVLLWPNGYVSFPFTLTAAIVPPASLDPTTCYPDYNNNLLSLLQNFSKMINYWICTTQNCSYLGGTGVAIDYSSLQVTWIGSNNVYTSVQIYVNMIGGVSVTAQNFAQCRADIMNYMYYFINWPPAYNPALLATPSGTNCPPISFQVPMFNSLPQQCPTLNVQPQVGI